MLTTQSSTPPEGTTFLPPDGHHAVDVVEEPARPIQSTEDIQREAKRPRVQQIQTITPVPESMIVDWPEPFWLRTPPPVYSKDDKLMQHGIRVVESIRRQLPWLMLYDLEADPKDKIRTVKIVKNPDFQHPDEVKEEYVTPDYETLLCLPEIPSQQEHAKLPEDLTCSNDSQVERCMSDEFIGRLDRQAKHYFSTVEQSSQKEIIANGVRHMNEEAFVAFRRYIAEKDLFEGFVCKFGEMLHHCFTFEDYRNVHSHYNFTVEMKRKDEECWTTSHYFAEYKLLHGRVKCYFCSPLSETDDGQCYSCMNQGVHQLKHPSSGGYKKGHKGSASECAYADSSDDADADSSDDNDECVGLGFMF